MQACPVQPQWRRPFPDRLLAAIRLDATVFEEVEHDREAMAQAVAVVFLSSLAQGLGGIQAPSVATLLIAPMRPQAGVTHIECPPHPISHREFLRELGSHAIRLTLPPGASLQAMHGDAEPRVGTMSPLSVRVAAWRDPSFRRSLEQFRTLGPRSERSSSELEPLAAALTRTLTSYRQGSA